MPSLQQQFLYSQQTGTPDIFLERSQDTSLPAQRHSRALILLPFRLTTSKLRTKPPALSAWEDLDPKLIQPAQSLNPLAKGFSAMKGK